MRRFELSIRAGAWAAACVAAAAALGAAGAAEGCSAAGVLDDARRFHDQDYVKAARDVSAEFVDQEGWTKDDLTIDAGTGTLIQERVSDSLYGATQIPNGGLTPDDWKSVLDCPTNSTRHGRTLDGESTGTFNTTMRDHMRLHVWEWDMELKGTPVATVMIGLSGATQSLTDWVSSMDWSGYGWTPGAPTSVQTPAQSSVQTPAQTPVLSPVQPPTPTPAPVASPAPEPNATPIPVSAPAAPMLHRAG